MLELSARTRSTSGSSKPGAGASDSAAQQFWWAVAAALGVGGAAAALVGTAAGALVYRCARPHGVWGSGEPPVGCAEDVSFFSQDGETRLSGWFFPAHGRRPAPAVVVCHGVWTGRREGLPWALRLQAAGFNVLCFDFRAHGLSEGRYITVGFHERKDVLGAVALLRTRPEVDGDHIGALGFSMGAVAAIQAAAESRHIAAVVADSPYALFLDAVRYSFSQIGGLPRYPFAPVALQWARWLVRVDARQLRPIDHVARLAGRPLLLIHCTGDTIVPVHHARMLYAAAGEPKELWLVPGGHHAGARELQPAAYAKRIEGFFRAALGVPAGLQERALRLAA